MTSLYEQHLFFLYFQGHTVPHVVRTEDPRKIGMGSINADDGNVPE